MPRLKNFVKKHWKKILVFLVVTAFISWIFWGRKNKNIESTQIRKGNLQEEMILSGEIDAVNHAKLSFETSGKIVFVGVKEGDKVNKGKLLSKLDTTILNSSYQIALSNLRLYEATAQNVLDQVKNNDNDETFAQKDQRTTAEANKDKAHEAVIQAKRNLDGAFLYAPFSGIVTYLAHPFPNVFTTAGAVEVEVIDPSTMYFKVLADQIEVTKLNLGQRVEIVLDPFEEKTFEGKVSNISFVPSIGEAGSTYSVKVDFKNITLSDSKFKIAMTGDAKFIISEKNDVLYLPLNYVKQDKQGKFIKINKKGQRQYIETGIESEDYIEIKGDLKEGQLVFD